jgi:3',5'-cyclic AMP phosphodiesterase CpdA
MRGREWFFVHLSDPQFGMFEPGSEEYYETPLVAKAIARINALRPDFVLCTGDLVDIPRSDVQMEHARTLLADLAPGIPFLPVPGNHDIGDEPSAEDLAWYREVVGRDRFSFNHRGWHFTGLNSCLLADGRAVPDEVTAQWSWLEEDLARPAAARAEGTLVFMHHPPFLEDEAEDDGYFNLPRASRSRLVNLLGRHGVRHILCGHLHRSHQVNSRVLEVLVAGPVGMPLGEGYSGLRLVKIGADGVRHAYFALDDAKSQEAFLNG